MSMTAAICDTDIDFLIARFGALTERREYVAPSDYIESVRYIDKSLSPFPGKFSYQKFPYFREIVDRLSPADPVRYVFVMKGNQCGYTTGVLEAGMMYYLGSVPEEQALVLPDGTMATDYAKTKLELCIDNCGLRPLIASQAKKAKGAKDTGDTTLRKQYPGGSLRVFGGGSGNRFRNFSYKVIFADEADALLTKIKGEGDVFSLLSARQDAFSAHSKLVIGSTPKEESTSLIYRLFASGDQRYYFVPCKFCGGMQRLEWAVWDDKDKSRQVGGIVWKSDPDGRPLLDTVGYKCRFCGEVMKNYDKSEIIPHGEWRSTEHAARADAASYHITALYNPPGMFSWEDYVSAWAEAWDIKNNRIRDKEKYRTFRNLKQGLPFREQHEQITYEKAIRFRRFGFARGHVPNKMAVADTGSPVLIVIGSVDVQEQGLYMDIVGYTDGGNSFTIDFKWIAGDVRTFGGPWNELAELFNSGRFADEDGRTYRISMMLVDSGHYTDWVYSFVQRFSAGVYACKGMDWIKSGESYQLFSPATLERTGLPLAYHINTGKMKDRISEEMNRLYWNDGQRQPPWYPNFPEDFGDDFFKMFEAEEKVDIVDKLTGRWLKRIWRWKYGAANHAFDTRVYNKAALEIFADDICRHELGMKALDWGAFWSYCAMTKAFYREAEK
ncbi:MAG: hypothetical protein HDR37_03800 [Treponema sp.]|nr:hypothetical protein [Treponema sp.]